MAFCDKVNASPEGLVLHSLVCTVICRGRPQVALKIIPAKMHSKEEKVALLSLTVRGTPPSILLLQ